MRKSGGYYLIEMLVAVGVSGLFITMLSSTLSDTLRIGQNGQNLIIAATIAEEMLENARNTPYSVLNQYPGAAQFIVNLPSSTSAPALRATPLQLDLTSSTAAWGAVTPSAGGYNLPNRWTGTNGNYFRGTVTETITPYAGTNTLDYVVVDVKVNFANVYGSSTGGTRTLERTATVFERE